MCISKIPIIYITNNCIAWEEPILIKWVEVGVKIGKNLARLYFKIT